jgi:putative hydrolase of the HAD superfamily
MVLKAIFLDAAGTLIKTARPVGESYASIAKKYGMEVLPEEIRERFRNCFASAPPVAFPGAQAKQLQDLERGWWKELVRRIFEPFGSFAHFEDYFSELFGYFSRAEAWSLYTETAETLLALRERGFILEVISNFDSRLFSILDGLGIASCFDSVAISSRVGYAKPAPEIFHKALALYHLKADEALHIGDSPDKDVAGANGAGLAGVLLDRNGRASKDSFRRIQNLKEILPMIDRRQPK